MNRRQFLKGSALAAAGIVSGASALAQGTLTFRGPAGRNPNAGNGNGQALRRFNTTTIHKGVSLGMISDGKTVEEKFQMRFAVGAPVPVTVGEVCDTVLQAVAAK